MVSGIDQLTALPPCRKRSAVPTSAVESTPADHTTTPADHTSLPSCRRHHVQHHPNPQIVTQATDAGHHFTDPTTHVDHPTPSTH
ncbi:hypothetical protein vseg_013236 [Gypsophila vaccaria]